MDFGTTFRKSYRSSGSWRRAGLRRHGSHEVSCGTVRRIWHEMTSAIMPNSFHQQLRMEKCMSVRFPGNYKSMVSILHPSREFGLFK